MEVIFKMYYTITPAILKVEMALALQAFTTYRKDTVKRLLRNLLTSLKITKKFHLILLINNNHLETKSSKCTNSPCEI